MIHLHQRLFAVGVCLSSLAIALGGCATTNSAAPKEDTKAAQAAADDDATTFGGMDAGRIRVGAISFVIPPGYRTLGPDDAMTAQVGGKRRISILLGDDYLATSTTPPPRFVVINTAEALSAPLSEESCPAVAASEAKGLGTVASDPRFVQTSVGPGCYFTDQPATNRQYAGFVAISGRLVTVISAGTGMPREDYEALLKSVKLPDPKLVIGDRLDAEMPNGFSLLEHEAVDGAGGIMVEQRRKTAEGKHLVRATFFAMPISVSAPLSEWKREGACQEYGTSVAEAKKRTLRTAKSFPHPLGQTCLAETTSPSTPGTLDVAYIVHFPSALVNVTCAFKMDDKEMYDACLGFGNSVKLIEISK